MSQKLEQVVNRPFQGMGIISIRDWSPTSKDPIFVRESLHFESPEQKAFGKDDVSQKDLFEKGLSYMILLLSGQLLLS